MYDVIIIGGGPAGYRAAFELNKKNKSVLLIEKNKIGGTCLNEGCIPTKSFLYSCNQKTMSFEDMILKKNRDIIKMQNGLNYQLKRSNIVFLKGEAFIDSKENDLFSVTVDNTKYFSRFLIIASGSKNQVFPISGLDLSLKTGFAITSKEFLTSDKEFKNNVAIIGGGVIGIEFAYILNGLGKKVTIFESKPSILCDIIDEDIRVELETQMKNDGISIICGIKIEEIDNGIVYSKNDNYFEFACDQVISATGRCANISDLGLDNIGVAYDRSIITNNKCETNIKNVYACGDVNGKCMLAHVAYMEAEAVVENICGNNVQVSYDFVPNVVFSKPELAFAGFSEIYCKKHNIEYSVSKCSMAYSSMFNIKYENEKGICKLIFNNKDELIGAQMFGSESSELIYILSDYIRNRLTKKELRNKVYPHPSIVEIFKETLNQ